MNNAELSDEALVKLAIDDNQSAYSKLSERYREKIEIYLHDNFGHILNDIEDITQLSLLKAFNNLDKFESRYRFSTWLYNIAKNTAIDSVRRNRASMENGLIQNIYSKERESIGKESNTNTSLYKSPEDEFITMQTYSMILSRIKSLEPKYREIADLRFIKELAYNEISEKVGLPVNTVKTRIKRAKLQLKDLELEKNRE